MKDESLVLLIRDMMLDEKYIPELRAKFILERIRKELKNESNKQTESA